MKTLTVLSMSIAAASIWAAPDAPQITKTSYDETNRVLAVTYTLPGAESAIVTLAATVGGKTLEPTELVGDVNRRLAPGAGYVAHWHVGEALGDEAIESVAVKLTAWSPATPPDYMAVLLGNPATVRYYASAEAVPCGVGSSRWKENWLLMRKIPAKNVTWRMGCAANDYCWNASEQSDSRFGFQPLKYVTTTHDYYIGVYEFTQGQYRALTGKTPSSGGAGAFDGLPNSSHYAVHKTDWKWHPVETVTWVDATNAMGKVAAASGLEFDLPTPEEWEFAARGETQWGTYNGAPHNTAVIAPIGINFQQQKAYYGGDNGVAHPYYAFHVPVGQKKPNKYGLYDTVGNIVEWCAGWVDEAAGTHPVKGGKPSMSGEGFGAGYTSVGTNYVYGDSWEKVYQGFRAACRIPEGGMAR